MSYRYITTALDGDVFVITLNRPEKRNAIGDAMLLELEAAFGQLPAAAKAGKSPSVTADSWRLARRISLIGE